MEPDRLAWLQKLTHACNHAIGELEQRGDPLVYALLDDIRRLRDRLQSELDGDAG